jgi:hypothetical protein
LDDESSFLLLLFLLEHLLSIPLLVHHVEGLSDEWETRELVVFVPDLFQRMPYWNRESFCQRR